MARPTTTRGARAAAPPTPPAPPREADLHEAALAYLARQSASAAVLARALDRRAAAWARKAARAGLDAETIAAEVARCRETVARIVARFREVGLVDDARFAEARARRLASGGRSRRAIAAHLAQRGVDAETARGALPDDPGAELASALVFARKRRIGPFARGEVDREARHKALGAMARAGFDFGVAERALAMDPDEAEERLRARRD